jgi:hypothetical protein
MDHASLIEYDFFQLYILVFFFITFMFYLRKITALNLIEFFNYGKKRGNGQMDREIFVLNSFKQKFDVSIHPAAAVKLFTINKT